MMKRSLTAIAVALAATVAHAEVTFDPLTGTGFVGKGDVQLVYGWNNKGLQDHADLVTFSIHSVSETAWTCTKLQETGNGKVNEIVQRRSTVTTTQGVVLSALRERNQVTGFILSGYVGEPTVVTEGDPVGSCPANPSGFTLDADSLSTQALEGGGGLQVSIDGLNWYDL